MLKTYASNGGTGAPTLPNVSGVGVNHRQHTSTRMEKVREAVRGFVQEAWMPFTAGVVSRFIKPRPAGAAWQSPFDLDGGERITRAGSFPSAERPFPYPYEIGAVSGFLPLQDAYSLSWAWAKTPTGPGVATPVPVPWQTTYPTLTKRTG